MMPGWAQDNNR